MELDLVKSFRDTLPEKGLKQCEKDAFCSSGGYGWSNSVVKLLLIKIRHLQYHLEEEKEKNKRLTQTNKGYII